VKRARGLYLDGNKKLSGDANGAVALYQSSLKAYPGYVAAYRGMGLAFVQLKDTPKALASFKTYVKLAPGAKDAPLIKKVIEKLEKESGG
jgi:regulator of sirC expression with transglutaminase-like and TPR domain